MSKIELNETNSGYNLQKINNNFKKIETEFNEKVLYRDNPDGEPNEMQNDLDMNGNRIYNLPTPTEDHEAARLKDVQDAVAGNVNANLIQFEPTEDISSTNVQGAIEEVQNNNNSLRTDLLSEGEENSGASLIGWPGGGFISDLKTEEGSSKIGYKYPNIFSIPRTVQDKLDDFVSISDFEITEDGTEDVTVLLQELISESEGKKLILGRNKIYLITSSLEVSSSITIDLNGSTILAQLTDTVPAFNVQSDNVIIENGNIQVSGTVMGGYAGSLNCIFAGNQATGQGFNNLVFRHLTVTTNRNDAGAHIGIIGECTNFNIHDITVLDNSVCRNIIGIEWGGTPELGTGHPHNGKIYNIKIGSITTPTFGAGGYAYGIWLSAAFNIEITNVTMERGYGLLMATRGDHANTYAPISYKSLVGTGISFNNMTISNCYGYGVRVIGSHKNDSLSNIPMSVSGKNIRVIGNKVGANNNFGIQLEQCNGVTISDFSIEGSLAAGIATGTAVEGLSLRDGLVSNSELYGISIGSSAIKAKQIQIDNIKFVNNNKNEGVSASTSAIVVSNSEDVIINNCIFGEEGISESQRFSVGIVGGAIRTRLNNNHTHSLSDSGIAYAVSGGIDPIGINNTAASGLTVSSGNWMSPIFTT